MDSFEIAQTRANANESPDQSAPVARSHRQAAQPQSVVQSGCCVPRIFGFCPVEIALVPVLRGQQSAAIPTVE